MLYIDSVNIQGQLTHCKYFLLCRIFYFKIIYMYIARTGNILRFVKPSMYSNFRVKYSFKGRYVNETIQWSIVLTQIIVTNSNGRIIAQRIAVSVHIDIK